jgi:hypothetical protein
LQEFIPGSPGQWTAFAVDANGIPRYIIDIEGGETGVITVRDGESGREVNRLDLGGQSSGDASNAACAADLDSLSNAELFACLDQIQAELEARMADN